MQSQTRGTPLKVKREEDSPDDCVYLGQLYRSPQDSAENCLDKTPELSDIVPFEEQDQDAQSEEDAPNQLVLYNPGASDTTGQIIPVPDPIETQPPLPIFVESNYSTKVLPSVGAFTVQCATCFKWRLIPTKEIYEEIRENILQEPFVCEAARKWRPDISCEDPADISQDGSRLWAIDKPNISQPPPGWERLLRIRGEGSTRFADVYYVAPSGKKLRSMVEIQKYLLEHPEYIRAGVNMSQFSFQIPKPLQDNYVRKRTYTKLVHCDNAALGMSRPLEPDEVNPISWAGPVGCPDSQNFDTPGSVSAPYFEAPDFLPLPPPAKKKAIRPLKQKFRRPVCEQPKIEEEEPQQSSSSAFDL